MSQQQQMFASAADLALKGINDVRYAREAGLPKDYSAEEALRRAKELLCEVPEPVNCVPQTEATVALLQKVPKNSDALEWTAKAQYLSGHFTDAAESYVAAMNATSSLSPEAALRLNLEAAEAWLMARNFVSAVNYYDAAAKMVRDIPGLQSKSDFNIQRASSHRFKGERLEALDCLLNPVEPVASSSALHDEMEHIIETLRPDELPVAIERLEADSTKNVRALLKAYEKEANACIAAGNSSAAETVAEKALAMHDEPTRPIFEYLLTEAQFVPLEFASSSAETREQYRQFVNRLEPIVRADPSGQSFGPLSLQLQLCMDYLGDRDCVTRTISYLEKQIAPLPPAIEMDIVEIQVLDQKYVAASMRLNKILKAKGLEPRLKTVASFYQVWTALVDGKVVTAEQWFKEWREALEVMRNTEPVNWTFGGANRTLAANKENFSAGSLELLKEMIAAMQDENLTPTGFHH